MGKSKIQWTEETWNPTRGCSRVSEGCRNCYAERQAGRFCNGRSDSACKRAAGMEPGGPFAGFVTMTPSGARWTGKVELIESMLDVPLRRKKPTMYFVNSMSDLFHEALSDEAIYRVFGVMALCPQHTFQVLTKRAERMRKWFGRWDSWEVEGYPLQNVWIGVSCEDQESADERSSYLRQVPAVVRFISQEPQISDINWGPLTLAGIDWLIIGGESGPGARPFKLEWARRTIERCKQAGTAAFVKQLGARAEDTPFRPTWMNSLDAKGGNWEVWPEELRVREYPSGVR